MIDDIKEALDSFTENVEGALTERDHAGIVKIHFELDLLKSGHEKKSKKKTLTGAADLGLDSDDNI